jgi:hypothetical protein
LKALKRVDEGSSKEFGEHEQRSAIDQKLFKHKMNQPLSPVRKGVGCPLVFTAHDESIRQPCGKLPVWWGESGHAHDEASDVEVAALLPLEVVSPALNVCFGCSTWFRSKADSPSNMQDGSWNVPPT